MAFIQAADINNNNKTRTGNLKTKHSSNITAARSVSLFMTLVIRLAATDASFCGSCHFLQRQRSVEHWHISLGQVDIANQAYVKSRQLKRGQNDWNEREEGMKRTKKFSHWQSKNHCARARASKYPCYLLQTKRPPSPPNFQKTTKQTKPTKPRLRLSQH